MRCRDLENLIRELRGVIVDIGSLGGNEQNKLVHGFRTRLAEILGNTPPGVDLVGIVQNLQERWDGRGSGPGGATGGVGHAAGLVPQNQDLERAAHSTAGGARPVSHGGSA